MGRTLILLYGILSYFIGVAGLACIILALATFIPFGFLGGENIGMNPVVWNVILVALWGIIHTVMARPGFKAKLTKIIPEPAERATYVLVAGLTSIVMIGYWKVVPGQVWSIGSTPLIYALWGIFVFGWVFLLAATFAINHFDLFGLRQVYMNFKNQERPPLNFVKRFMYKNIRHPIQTGVLIGIWATPNMTMTQIVLSLGFTAYIFIGLWFEEKDLIAEHGDSYEQYRNETGKVLPKFTK
jgi:protein-S-isoprenylcysteine O-methyltransferase Ste14